MARATVKAPKIVGMINFMMAMNGIEILLGPELSLGWERELLIRRSINKVKSQLIL